MHWKVLTYLCCFYFIYLLIGAAIFNALEHEPEKKRCQKVQEAIHFLILKLTNSSPNVSLEDFKRLQPILQTAASQGITVNENFDVTCVTHWDFQSALFFSGTVVTTIGYGHISPTTYLGRSICILYAIIGIPLFALMFSGLGENVAEFVSKIERKLTKQEKPTRMQRSIILLVVLASFLIMCLLIPSSIFMVVEKWPFHDAFYYSFVTLTTIGFGDYVVGINPNINYLPLYRTMVYFWILFGLAFMASIIAFLTEFWKKTGKKVKRKKAGYSKKKLINQEGNRRDEDIELTGGELAHDEPNEDPENA